MRKKFRYKNMYMFASLQFCGHMDTYFIDNTEKLVVYLINPRLKSKNNVLRIYARGKLIRESAVWSSGNLFLYYLSWYIHHLNFCFKYFKKQDKVIMLSMHPIAFFGMSIVRMFRSIIYVYWIGDYFPPTKISLRLFEILKKFYHSKVDYHYYLSDTINSIFNGKVLDDDRHKTVMWGLESTKIKHNQSSEYINLLFIGLLKEGQELEVVFSLLSEHKHIKINIIGICPDGLYQKNMMIIKKYHIEKQVYFPNTFYSEYKLRELAVSCHIGVALYDPSPLSSTYYTDPGKVKAYAEYRLPVILSDTSDITTFIRRYHAGEIIQVSKKALFLGIQKIRNNYQYYLEGADTFNRAFYYRTYYKGLFSF